GFVTCKVGDKARDLVCITVTSATLPVSFFAMFAFIFFFQMSSVMNSRAGPSGGGGVGMKCRNMFEPNTTKISPSKLRAMIVAIFIIVSPYEYCGFPLLLFMRGWPRVVLIAC